MKVLSYPQFEHNRDTVGLLGDIGVQMQITDLNKGGDITTSIDITRIHVSNTTTPQELIEIIENLTQK